MKVAQKYFREYKEGLLGGINTIAIGRIENFDPVKMKADVVILPDNELIIAVPVASIQTDEFYIRVPYQKGDSVVVAFAQRDIDDILYGGNASATDRMLSLDDAIVIGGINLFTESLPADNTDKLVIGEKEGTAKIVLGGGKISLIGDVDINGTALKAGGVSF